MVKTYELGTIIIPIFRWESWGLMKLNSLVKVNRWIGSQT